MMSVLDGDGTVLNCKMVTQMIEFTGVLAKGALIEILQFCALSFAHHAHELFQKILPMTCFQFKQNLGKMLAGVKEYKIKKMIWSETNSVFLRSGGIMIDGGNSVVDQKSHGISDGVGDGIGFTLDLKC